MSDNEFYAHSLENDSNQEHWHLLSDHLYAVAELAGKMAAEFGSEEWG